MNYHAIYYQIISQAQKRVCNADTYYEKHHILPQCLGGTNDVNNLVKLTAREHFICHMLLVKMYSGHARRKMLYALNGMQRNNQYQKRNTSRLYEYFRKEFSNLKREEMIKDNPMHNSKSKVAHAISMHTRKNVGMLGRKHSIETRAKMRAARAKQVITDETKKKLSEHRKKESQNLDYVNGCRIGWYITPWGRFKSLTLAAKNKSCNRLSIKNWCRINNSKVLSMRTAKNSELFSVNDVGKTFAELGFGFEEL